MGVDHASDESRRTSIHADRVLLADHERDAARSASRQTRSAKGAHGVATNSVNTRTMDVSSAWMTSSASMGVGGSLVGLE